MKTSLRMNMGRYVSTQLDGNILSELVKNGIEAEDSTFVNIILDRDNHTLIVENDGTPVQSEKELDDFFLEIGTTGKNQQINFGKGFSAVFLEKTTIVISGNFRMTCNEWNDITIEKQDSFFSGTSVTVFLHDDSEILLKEDAMHRHFLKGFLTSKKIIFNGEDLPLKRFDEKDYCQIIPGCWVKYGYFYHGFVLHDGSIAPVEYKGTAFKCSIIIGNILHVNSERNSLRWSTEVKIQNWYDEQVIADIGNAVDDISDLVPFIESCFQWLDDFFQVIGVPPITYGSINTFLDVIYLSKLVDILEPVALNMGLCEINSELEHHESGIQREYRKRSTIPNTFDNVRKWTETFLMGDVMEIFGDVIIGVYIDNGEVLGNATVEDTKTAAKMRITSMTEAFTFRSEYIDPFVAIFVEGRFLRFLSDKFIWIDIDVELEVMDMKGTIENPPGDFRNFIRSCASQETLSLLSAISSGDLSLIMRKFEMMMRMEKNTPRKSTEQPDWKFMEISGIPVLIHKSIEDPMSMKFTTEKQLRKWTLMFTITKLVMDYSNGYFGETVIPTLFMSKSKFHKNMAAFSNGNYISLNTYHTKLPENEDGAVLVMLHHVVHELVHRRYKRHDRKFIYAVESTLEGLFSNVHFMDDLFSISI